ncbi:MAG: hypothetical protein M0R66_06985 [Candidatus Omnitrophica bacterium]|nr:hypothetical protein [Candidatus Omnitrophota bacterium]
MIILLVFIAAVAIAAAIGGVVFFARRFRKRRWYDGPMRDPGGAVIRELREGELTDD